MSGLYRGSALFSGMIFFFLAFSEPASCQEPQSDPPPVSAITDQSNTTPPAPVSPPETKPQAPPREVLFSLHELKIEGNTILPKEKLDLLMAPFLGDQKGFADIEKARAELEKAYHDGGFPTVLVIVPEQTIENQSVRMDVIEAKLDKIELTGNRYFSTKHILQKLPSLKLEQVPYEPDVEKELTAANLNPDLFITPVLSPGEEQGKVSLLLNVKDRFPLHGSLDWNNKQSPHTKRFRLDASIQYTNLFDQDQVLTFNTSQSPEAFGKVQLYGLNYLIPLSKPDTSWMIYINRSESGSVLTGTELQQLYTKDITLKGNSTVSGIRYQFPLSAGGKWSHLFSFALEYKEIGPTSATIADIGNVTGLSTTGSLEVLSSNAVNYLPVTLTYTGTQVDSYGLFSLNFSVKGNRAGMVGWGGKSYFGGEQSTDPENMPGNRIGSTGNFAIFQAGSDLRRILPRGFEIWLKGNGQVATEPLISAEEFFGGGVESVRGYLENEVAGDNGLRGSVELVTPRLPALIAGKSKEEMHLSAFFDAAELFVKEAPPDQKDHFYIWGTGIGLTFQLPENFRASFYQAWALHDSVITQKLDRLFHFSVKFLF
jgi:hemolysin activation/secretion protein